MSSKGSTEGTVICDQTFTKKNASNGSFGDAIVVSNFEQADSDLDSEEIHGSARKEIEKSIPDATIDRNCDPIRCEKSRGLGVMERLQVMKDEIEFIKAESQDMKTDIQRLQIDVEALKITSCKDPKE